MSWLSKGLKKLGKVAVKVGSGAASLGLVPGLGAIAPVIVSKLQSAGENRRKLAQAQALSKQVALTNLIDKGRGATLGDIRKRAASNPKLGPKEKLAITGRAAQLLDTSTGTQKEFRSKKAVRDATAARAADLTKADWEALAAEYQASGKKQSWETFVAQRI